MSPITNTSELRSSNKKRIIGAVRSKAAARKSQLARDLDLSFSTVSNICNELMAEGMLRRAMGEVSANGRPPNLFDINPSSRVSLCLDFTGISMLRVGLVDLQNRILLRSELVLPSGANAQDFVSAARDSFAKLLLKAAVTEYRVTGIGGIVPGIFDRQRRCVVNSTFPFLEGSPLEDLLSRTFHLPVYIENEANLAALAVSMDGGRRKHGDILFIFVGEGLGLGIIHRGRIFPGMRGFAGEIAHIPLGDPGFECYCGNHGCIEGTLSSSGIQREMDRPDAAARLGSIMGELVSVLANLFDPEIVYIGGDRDTALQDMLPQVRREVGRRVLLQQSRDIQVNVVTGVHDLFFKGASEMLIQQWLTS